MCGIRIGKDGGLVLIYFRKEETLAVKYVFRKLFLLCQEKRGIM